MVSVQNISVSFGSFDLLSDISFLINSNDRIGLAGKNGAGKTTLLRIIAGLQGPTSGKIEVPKDFTIGYLPQQMKVDDSTTVMNEALTAFNELIELSEDIERCRLEIARRSDYHSDDYLKLCDHLNYIQDRHHILGGVNYIAETEQTLIGLGFDRKDFDRPTRELSGGWRMRVELAKLLLKKPNLFLLDEPTNHLDIESIQWVESFLENYPGAVAVVSHDRAFLDNVTKRTIEISLGKIYDYKVSWSEFVILRKERREQQIAAFRNQQKMIGDTEKFIERFRYKATKAVQVQSKIKQLDKVERIEIDEEDTSTLNIRFSPAPRSGSVVVESESVSFSYGNLKVLENVSFTAERGEKIAFVGRNGEGKTTFSRIIIGELHGSGKMKTGHNVRTGYFAQNQDELLNGNKTVFETIDETAKGDIRTKIRDMLAAFLFRGEDVDKKVKVLSGGERSRLALVKLLLEPYNLLVLDEPTNHLDMRSKDILKQALIKYDGTLIVVSHDRDFLDGLVRKVYEFKNRKIKENIGGIYDFLRKKKIENLRELERKENVQKNDAGENTVSENKRRYIEKKDYDRNLRKLTRKVSVVEQEIEELEKEIEIIDQKLSDPAHIEKADEKFYNNYNLLKKSLNEKMGLWTEYTHELEIFLKNNS
jgi:ATP-binding cassette, subfamily F, member 3